MKKVLKILALALTLLVIIITLFTYFLNFNQYKLYINKVASKYGVKLEVEGNIKFSFFPTIGFYIDGPTKAYFISKPTKPFVEIKKIKVNSQILPLFAKKVIIDHLYLDNFKFYYDQNFIQSFNKLKKKDSDNNNLFSDPKVKKSFNLILDLVEVREGYIQYDIGQSRIEIDKVNLRSQLRNTSELTGLIKSNQNITTTEINLKIDNLQDLIEKGHAKVETILNADAMEFKIRGTLENNQNNLLVKDLNIKFDFNEVDGILNYNKTSHITNFDGNAHLKSLIIPNDFATFFENSQNITKKHMEYDAAREIWNSSNINLSYLSKLAINLKLVGKEVQVYGLNIDKFIGNLNVKNNKLNFIINNGSIAHGQLKANINILPKSNQFITNIEVKNAQLSKLCKDILNFENIEGLADIQASLETKGETIHNMVSNLYGTGKIDIKNGKIIEIKAIPNNILNLSNLSFDKISGDFNIKNGKIYNQNLLITSPWIELLGHGEINLVNYTINYLINPEKVYDNKIANKGLLVEINGSLRDPKVSLNTERFFKNKIKDVSKEVFKGDTPINKTLNNIIDSIF